MRHGAGAAPPRSRYIGAASLFLLGSSLFLLGIFVLGFAASRALAGETLDQELRNHSVRAHAPDGAWGALASVNGRSLNRRAPDGVWSAIATTELDLAC